MGQVDQQDGAQQGEADQYVLKDEHHPGMARIALLDHQHQFIDLGHIALHGRVENGQQGPPLGVIMRCQQLAGPRLDVMIPFIPQLAHLLLDRRLFRQEERAFRIPFLQADQGRLELFDDAVRLGEGGLTRERAVQHLMQAQGERIGAHALRSGVVDGRRAPFRLARHV